MLQSIRSKVLLAILVVTIVTACSITVVFYFKSAGMIEENYSTNLYGRVKQTVTSLDDSLQEIYYINVKAASDINMVQYIKEYRSSHSGEALDGIAELLRNYRTEYKDLSSLYFIFPDERMAVTSEDYPVCKRDIPEAEIEIGNRCRGRGLGNRRVLRTGWWHHAVLHCGEKRARKPPDRVEIIWERDRPSDHRYGSAGPPWIPVL